MDELQRSQKNTLGVNDSAYYDYDLPEHAIAQTPSNPRSQARLLDGRGGEFYDRRVADLPKILNRGDLVVVNETRVMACRYLIRRSSGGKGEVLVISEESRGLWRAMVRPSSKLRLGDILFSGDAPLFEVMDVPSPGAEYLVPRLVKVLDDELFRSSGETPLPPYIKERLSDPERYQTVFGANEGSVAAPTAGLHLDELTLDAMRAQGIDLCTVDLQVGLGTFIGLTQGTLDQHHMHTERYSIPKATWEKVRTAQRVVAVGTTVLRALESAALTNDLEGETALFIRPGFEFRAVDLLMTNFHVPKSTLLVLVEAFYGPRWRDLYTHALRHNYRFLSFGDATLVDLQTPRGGPHQ